MKKLSVFVSGKGSLLEAMIKDNLVIRLVLADRNCRGLELAKAAGIPAKLLRRTDFSPNFDRRAYTLQIVRVLLDHRIYFVAMAGFMTVLHQVIFENYQGRIINTHPALLPSFKGDHAVRDALAYGVKVTGCTIHLATEKLDEGKILGQKAVRVMPCDTEETLHERIKRVERRLYPYVIREFEKTI